MHIFNAYFSILVTLLFAFIYLNRFNLDRRQIAQASTILVEKLLKKKLNCFFSNVIFELIVYLNSNCLYRDLYQDQDWIIE